jgi:hypothetical protein
MYMFIKMDVKHNLLTVGLYFFPRREQALPYPSPADPGKPRISGCPSLDGIVIGAPGTLKLYPSGLQHMLRPDRPIRP